MDLGRRDGDEVDHQATGVFPALGTLASVCLWVWGQNLVCATDECFVCRRRLRRAVKTEILAHSDRDTYIGRPRTSSWKVNRVSHFLTEATSGN